MKEQYIITIMYESFDAEDTIPSTAYLIPENEEAEDYLLRLFLYELKQLRKEENGKYIVEEETECMVGDCYAVITWHIGEEKYHRYYELIPLEKAPRIPKLNQIAGFKTHVIDS